MSILAWTGANVANSAVRIVPAGTEVEGLGGSPLQQPALLVYGDDGFCLEGSKAELVDALRRSLTQAEQLPDDADPKEH